MNKTIKINLGGILFQIDGEAYNILRGYLNEIDARVGKLPGGAETLEDIEARIAEIFQSQGAAAGVISADNVEEMIKIIGRPGDFETGDGAEGRNREHTSVPRSRTLYRNPDDSIIGGICGGMGSYLDIDPVWIRVIFIVFAIFAGVGFFVYLALWIALPKADPETMKRESYMKGTGHAGYGLEKRSAAGTAASPHTGNACSERLAGALNEILRAGGRILFIAMRVFLVLLGLALVLSGFLALLGLIMVFIFKFPGIYSSQAYGLNFSWLSDFLNYAVNPSTAPWILTLAFIVLLIPLLAMIYLGIKMIFWFRARDGLISLAGFLIWLVCLAALSALLFNEGTGYAETTKKDTGEVLKKTTGNVYIFSGNKINDIRYDREISFPCRYYRMYFTDNLRNLCIAPSLAVGRSNDEYIRINVRKRSSGRTRDEATGRMEQLVYNYSVEGDTIFLDEYFRIPEERKWSFDNIVVSLYIPEGTKVSFSRGMENMLRTDWNCNDGFGTPEAFREYGTEESVKPEYEWIMTEDGLSRKSVEP